MKRLWVKAIAWGMGGPGAMRALRILLLGGTILLAGTAITYASPGLLSDEQLKGLPPLMTALVAFNALLVGALVFVYKGKEAKTAELVATQREVIAELKTVVKENSASIAASTEMRRVLVTQLEKFGRQVDVFGGEIKHCHDITVARLSGKA